MSMKVNDYSMARQWLKEADAILITASYGLSIAEGYHIFADNEPFRRYFGKYAEKYGLDCIIRGMFTPMMDEDRDGYDSTMHQYMIDDYDGSKVMTDLLELVSEKKYFIVTSNADTHFQINGFDNTCIFEIEGNIEGLHEGSPEWVLQRNRFAAFIQDNADKNAVLLELGIGSRNRLIKAPTMDMAKRNDKWKYITMNMPDEINVPELLQDKTLVLEDDIGSTLDKLLVQ